MPSVNRNFNTTILYWNAQGISTQNKQIELQNFMQEKNVEIALISETFLKPEHSFDMPNYTIYRTDRPTHGGGVAIAIKNSIIHKQIAPYKTTLIENVSIELNLNGQNTIITAVYSPRFLPSFKNDIIKLTPTDKKWNDGPHNAAGKVLADLQTNNSFMIHHTSTPTHHPHSGHSPSNIDILISNCHFAFDQIAAEGELNSDHTPIICSILSTPETSKPSSIYNYRSVNWPLYHQELLKDLPNIFNLDSCENIESAIDILQGTIKNARAKAVKKIFPHAHMNKIARDTQQTIKLRNVLKRQWQRAHDPTERHSLKASLNALNATIKNKISSDINNRWNDTIKNLKTGSKEFWKLSKKLRSQGNKKLPIFTTHDMQITCPTEKVEMIATAFQNNNNLTQHTISKFESKVAKSIQKIDNSLLRENTITLFTIETLNDTLRMCKPYKASGFDDIPNILIKKLPPQARVLLLSIFNQCLKIGYWPNAFKNAKIVPIPKPGKPHDNPRNYRPISLLNSLGKIMEKLLYLKIECFANENNIINDTQFGFRREFSTTHQLKRVVQHIKNEKAQRRSTGAVFMDVEKAFDAVWHNGLIHKLLKYKFPLHIIKMIKNYLSGRKFAVFADGSVSNWKQMEAGLPQGSPLSAILYSIYTADIPVPRDCLAAFFADDAAYLASAKNSNAIVRKLNKILVRIDNYYCDWKIKINAEKTQAVIFPFNRSNKRIPNLQIRVRDIAIQPQQKAKYLGLTLDAHLNFAEHIKDIRKKSYAKMAALYPLLANKHLSIKNKLIIYKATLRPSITYAAPIWVDIAPTHLKTLQIFQNKCL